MKASDYIVEYLAENASEKIFGYIGGMIAHIADSAARSANVEFVNTINEQGAAFAAEGYARVSGKTGVAVATSGPGATNLLTGVGSCFFDSVPVIFITGQVNTYEFKGDLPIRQRGFQETKIVEMARPITKYCAYVGDAASLRYELEKAVFIASCGRKGPTLLDIPMNIQRADLDFEKQKSFFGSREYKAMSKGLRIKKSLLAELAKKIAKAKRPIILAGGGVRIAGATELLRAFAEKNGIAVVESLMGRDSVPFSGAGNMGLIGVYANRYGNFALGNADFALILGSRLDSRQTGTGAEFFLKDTESCRVDIDENELNHSRIKVGTSICADVADFLRELSKYNCGGDRTEWNKFLSDCKAEFPSEKFADGGVKAGNLFVEKLSRAARKAACVAADVGQNQMWTAQSFENSEGQRMLFSGGMGAMGFALPATIGAAIASGKVCVAICGDGGFQMNIQELEVVARRRLPLKIFVMNNRCLGMVRQFQEQYFGGLKIGTVDDYSAPDFVKIARAYKLKGRSISPNISQKKLDAIFTDKEAGVYVVELGGDSVVEPKLSLGVPIEDMSPKLPREKFLKYASNGKLGKK